MNSEEYSISLATQENITEIHQLIRKCAKALLDSGLKQWDENYPSKDVLANDIKNNTLFVYKENSKIIGVAVANTTQDNEYNAVQWRDTSNDFLVIHRLGVDPNSQRKSIGKKLINHIEKYARKKGHSSIRLDTFSLNPISVKFYKRLNYTEIDHIHLPYQPQLFICFEKLIN